MHSLLLKLSGPLQSWGSDSRFIKRGTETEPTKSGVIGLLASALGIERGESLEKLAALSFAVRVDKPGRLIRDYQTAINWKATTQADRNPKLSTRYYLSDATFVVAIGGERHFLEQIDRALQRPAYPLFLGRRSCPANVDLLLGLREGSPSEALQAEEWHADDRYRSTQSQGLALPVLRDGLAGESGDRQRDIPISFSQEQRAHAWREIVHDEPVVVMNPAGRITRDSFFETVAEA